MRLVLVASSHTAPPGARDPRDSAGYAIRELWIGRGAGGAFTDVLRHGTSRQSQSITYASSTDPWHRASDIDLDLEQAGFDRVARSGLTNGLPMMIPVPVLFSTPEDGANELRFLVHRGYAFDRVELGRGARRTVRHARGLRLAVSPLGTRAPRHRTQRHARRSELSEPRKPDDDGVAGGLRRRALDDAISLRPETRNRLDDFGFLSFEWYPFDDVCAPTAPQLASAPGRLTEAVQRLRDQGVPRTLPLLIAEFGYSAFASRAEVDVEGALFDADLVGHFLSLGGATAFLYGYEPTYLDHEPRCNAWGNNALFLATSRRNIRHPVAAYHAMRLLTHEWLEPGAAPHEIFAAEANGCGTARTHCSLRYAVKRPDGKWSVLLVNRDAARVADRAICVCSGDSNAAPITGLHDEWLFSRAQYRWRADGANGHPDPDRPPKHRSTRSDVIVLPPYSLAVVRGSP